MPRAARRFSAVRHDESRGNSAARLYDRRWRKRRRVKLLKDPLCEECKREGRLTLATDVDHVIPHRGDRRLFDDDDNLQSLCKPCHSKKTARGE